MIFIIGLILYLIGRFTFDHSVEARLTNLMGGYTTRDAISSVFVVIGAALMFISLGIFAWEYLP